MIIELLQESSAGVLRKIKTKQGFSFEVVNRNLTYKLTTCNQKVAEMAFNLL